MGKKNKNNSQNSTLNSSFSNSKVGKNKKTPFSGNKKQAVKQNLNEVLEVTNLSKSSQKKTPNKFKATPQKTVNSPTKTPKQSNDGQMNKDSQKPTGSSKKKNKKNKNQQKQNPPIDSPSADKNTKSSTNDGVNKPLSKRARRKLKKLEKQNKDDFLSLIPEGQHNKSKKNASLTKTENTSLLDVAQGKSLFDSGSESEDSEDEDIETNSPSKKSKTAQQKEVEDDIDREISFDIGSDEDESEDSESENVSQSFKKTKKGNDKKPYIQQVSNEEKSNQIDFGSSEEDDNESNEEEGGDSSEVDSDIPTINKKPENNKKNSKFQSKGVSKSEKEQSKGQDCLKSKTNTSLNSQNSNDSSVVLSLNTSTICSESDDSNPPGEKVSLKRKKSEKSENSDESGAEAKDFIDDEAEEGNETSEEEDESEEDHAVESPKKKPKYSPREEKHGQENIEEHKAFIAKLPFNTTENDLRRALSGVGKIKSIVIPSHKEVEGQCRGFAFVTLQDKQSLDRVLELDNQAEINGQTLAIRKYNQDRPGGERGGRGGGFRGGRGGRGGGFRGGRGGGGFRGGREGGGFRGGREGGGFRGGRGGGFRGGRGGFGGGNDRKGRGGFKKTYTPNN